MDFSLRIHQSELLDRVDIPRPDIEQNLKELAIINRLLGGHRSTIGGFRALKQAAHNTLLAEIGCGGGDNLLAIQKSEPVAGISFIGVDLNADCIHYAKRQQWKKRPDLIISDYRRVVFEQKPDILFAALFCHHLSNDELVSLFGWMKENAKQGFFINDLHRHPFAYHAIRILTRLFSKSYLVKNDAPLSVMNGFKKSELKKILNRAGISRYSIRWKWAFRWLIVVKI